MSKLHVLNRSVSTALYGLEFLISALILGIFSYFLANLSKNDKTIPQWEKAVEGISGAAVIYTAFAVILTCFFGGLTFFAFVAVLLNVCFCAGMVAIAILARDGRKSCGTVNDSPIGPGNHVSCQLQKVVFAVAIIGAFLFLVSAVAQVMLSRSHNREKRYGPSPANNYTSGSGKRRPWQRKKNAKGDAEMGAFSSGALKDDKHRSSDITGTTVPVTDTTYGGDTRKYGEPTVPTHTYPPQQTTGVVGTGHTRPVSELDTAHHAGPNPYAQNQNPYAEVHHGGYVH